MYKFLFKYLTFSFFLFSIIFSFGAKPLLKDVYNFKNYVPIVNNLDYDISTNSVTTNFDVGGLTTTDSIGYFSSVTEKSFIKNSYWNTTITTSNQLYDALDLPNGTQIALQSLGGSLSWYISPVPYTQETFQVFWQIWDSPSVPSAPNGFVVENGDNGVLFKSFDRYYFSIYENSGDIYKNKLWFGNLNEPNAIQEWVIIVNNTGDVAIKSSVGEKYIQNYKNYENINAFAKHVIVLDTISYFQFTTVESDVFNYQGDFIYFTGPSANGPKSIEISSLESNKDYLLYNRFTSGFELELQYNFKTLPTPNPTPGVISDLAIELESFDSIIFSFNYVPGSLPTIVEYSIDSRGTWVNTNIPDQLGKYNVLIDNLSENTLFTLYLRTFSGGNPVDELGPIGLSTTPRTIGSILSSSVFGIFYNSISFEYSFVFNGLETTLQYSINAGTTWITTTTTHNSSGDFNYTIDGLTEDTVYNLRIRTMEGNNFGPTLVPIGGNNITTPLKMGRITSLEFVSATYSSILVKFDYQNGDGNTIIQSSTNNINWVNTSLEDIAGEKQFNFINLNSGQNYTLYLRTFNDNQNSTPSSTQGDTIERVEGTLNSSRVINVTSTSIEIEYDFTFGGLETTVQYSIDQGNSWVNIRTFNEKFYFVVYTYTITNLMPQTTYTILLRTQTPTLSTPPIIPEGGNGITTSSESSSSMIWIIIGSTLGGLLILGIGGFYWYKRSKKINN